MLALIGVFCGTLLARRRRVEKEEVKEEEKGVEPRRQNRREKEGSRMCKGTRVPFQTLSHSFSLKRADVCAHGGAPHIRACTQTHGGRGAECTQREKTRRKCKEKGEEVDTAGRRRRRISRLAFCCWRWCRWWRWGSSSRRPGTVTEQRQKTRTE